MGTGKRLVAAGVLVLPLLLGAGGTALAGSVKGLPDASQIQDQAAQNGTVQNNINVSPVNQVSIGSKGDQSAMTWTNQNNVNDTEQDQYEEQDED